MIISKPQIILNSGRVRALWQVTLEGEGAAFQHTGTARSELWIDWPESYFVPEEMHGDAALVILLPLAMRLGERIRVEGTVSGDLIWNVLEAMEIYQGHFPDDARAVPLEATARNPMMRENRRIGSFFSGGVDSFYNLAETLHLRQIYGTAPVTDLWLLKGFDINQNDDELWAKVYGQLSGYKSLPEGLTMVDVWTNARDLHGKVVSWENMGFGPILGGIAKCFASEVGQVLLGSSGANHIRDKPHASSPLIDPKWSCDVQRVRHFTCRANRAQKIARIVETMPESLNVLRVCWLNPDKAYNCGVCEKCLRTQMQLEIYRVLDDCPTFDVRLTPRSLRGLTIPWREKTPYTREMWQDLSRQAKRSGLDEYATIIDAKLRKARFKSLTETIFSAKAIRSSLRRLARRR